MYMPSLRTLTFLYRIINLNTNLHCFCTHSKIPAKFRDDFIKLCSKGSLKEAFVQIRHEIWSKPGLFSHLLQGCIPAQCLAAGKQLHCLIITSGLSLDRFLCNHLLNMYTKCEGLQTAIELFDTMPRRNVMSFNILMGGFVQDGNLNLAQQLFDEMPERNLASWNAMITGLTQFEFNEEGLHLFFKMHRSGMQPDHFTLGSILKGCAGLKAVSAGKIIHVYAIKSGFYSDLCVGSSLVHMYMKCGIVEEGEKVFENMPVHNIVSYNAVIAGRAQNGQSEEALDKFIRMRMARLLPDRITFVSAISSCSELATLGQGQQVHAQAIKVGADSSVSVRSSLVSMYSKCGCLEDSLKSFAEFPDLDMVLWSSMIAAYGFHGHGKEAIGLLQEMERQGLEPNDVTFLSILSACSHSGLKEQGLEIFELMTKKHELEPRLEHYTCIVDLLGRSGFLNEAEALIRSMPIKPDTIIWKTLLSACKIHKNREMAKRVAESVLELDPQDSAPYVLLSNIHASANRWEDVTKVRKSMRDGKVKKEPGISWLEVKNQVHQFYMGDQSHPQWREIDGYLKELSVEMKKHGYIPDTSSVLHDMDVEEKEYWLAHHSEKLAVAFGLLNIPAKAPIRVMKNLRVCDDCHVAIKYISKISMREIVVRDTSRFHHFRDGICSCGDYW